MHEKTAAHRLAVPFQIMGLLLAASVIFHTWRFQTRSRPDSGCSPIAGRIPRERPGSPSTLHTMIDAGDGPGERKVLPKATRRPHRIQIVRVHRKSDIAFGWSSLTPFC